MYLFKKKHMVKKRKRMNAKKRKQVENEEGVLPWWSPGAHMSGWEDKESRQPAWGMLLNYISQYFDSWEM